MEIREIKDNDFKKNIAHDILNDLPEWFGIPSSTKAYIKSTETMRMLVVYQNEEAVGFLTLHETSTDTIEIFVLGLKKKVHRLGYGTQLLKTAFSFAKEKYRFMSVKTVDEGTDFHYDQTIAFYKKMGFSKLEVIKELWGPSNPCLIMIKCLKDTNH